MPIDDQGKFVPYESDEVVDLDKAWDDTKQICDIYMDDMLKIMQELDRRQMDALDLYTPLPYQERYHASVTPMVVMRKGNRVGGEQPYTSTVLTPYGPRNMGSLLVGDTILGGDGKSTAVEEIIEFGESDVYRFEFSDGTSTEAGINHNWTCWRNAHFRARRPKMQNVNEGEWEVVTTRDLIEYVDEKGYKTTDGRNGNGRYKVVFPVVPPVQYQARDVLIDPYTLGVLIGDGNFTHGPTTIVSEDQEIIDSLVMPEGCVLHEKDISNQREKYGKSRVYSIHKSDDCSTKERPIRTALRIYGLQGKGGHEKHIPHEYMYNSVEVRLELLRGLMDTDGRASKSGGATFYTTSKDLVEDVLQLVRSLGGNASVKWRDNTHNGVKGRMIAHMEIYGLGEMNPFKLSRKADRYAARKNRYPYRRRLANIEYVGRKKCRCIQVGNASHTYLTDDFIVTHNSLCGFAEDARCLLQRDPYKKYGNHGYKTVVCLGYGERHIANVIYRYLFQPGAFRIIRDQVTLQWRVFRPWPIDCELTKTHGIGDEGREKEAIQAPPFIPPDQIKGRPVWVNAGAKIFQEIRLKNGWKVIAANSNGDPRQLQGIPVSLLHIDEDIANQEWFFEQYMRLLDEGGFLRWTAMAHGDNDILTGLYNMADAQADLPQGDPDKQVECIQVSTFENPYIPKKSVDAATAFLKSMGEDVYRKRILGDTTNESIFVYENFHTVTHDVRHENNESDITKAYAENGYFPPKDWCIYTATDPGHRVAGTLFIAVPPPKLGTTKIIFDEVYLKQATAIKWAPVIAEKYAIMCVQDQLIDMHGGRITSFDTGERAHTSYSKRLKEHRAKCRARGHLFKEGCDNIKFREERVRQQLSTMYSQEGPGVLIDINRCPNLISELRGFKKKFQRGSNGVIKISDEANRTLPCHLIECMEYLLAFDLPYIEPVSPDETRMEDLIAKMLKEDEDHQPERDGMLFGELSMTSSYYD